MPSEDTKQPGRARSMGSMLAADGMIISDSALECWKALRRCPWSQGSPAPGPQPWDAALEAPTGRRSAAALSGLGTPRGSWHNQPERIQLTAD